MKPLMKSKKYFVFLVIILFIVLIHFPPNLVSRAQIENIWGVSKGDSRIYQIQKEFKGDFEGIAETIILKYYIINNFDFNSNNISDIELDVTDLTKNSKYLIDLMDDTWWYWREPVGWERYDYINMYFKGYTNQSLIETLERPFPLCWTFLLLPIKGNDSLNIGINWTYSLNYINDTSSGYTAYNNGDLIVINVNKQNQLDLNYNTYYNDTGEIVWEKTTGWLNSISLTRTYDTPINYTISITVDSSPSTQTIINVGDIISWIGLAFGICGLTFLNYIYFKYRRVYLESEN